MMKKSGLLLATLLLAGAASFAAPPPKDLVPQAAAQAKALNKYPGTVKSAELEKEKGRWVYSFDIVGKDKKLHEVWVDAHNEKIVGHKIESAGAEATEQKEEAGGKEPKD
jgi:uncharacterized membrane protein YkoI